MQADYKSESKEWNDFIVKHSDVKQYTHFDERKSLKYIRIQNYVKDKQKIAIHPFYPFIHFTKKMVRYSSGEKKNKKREIYYCSHLDRCVYQRYAFLINREYNKKLENDGTNKVSIAYRNNLGKDNITFAKDTFNSIKRLRKCMVFVGDFTDFFDNLDHIYLKKMLCNLFHVNILPRDYFNVFKSITQFASWDWNLLILQNGYKMTTHGVRKKILKQKTILTKENFYKYKKCIKKNNNLYGIPQGSPISAILANVYMLDFDKSLNTYVSKNNGIYYRYSDDFIIILPFKTLNDINVYLEHITSNIEKIPRLKIKEEKKKIYIYENNHILKYHSDKYSQVNYLGFMFNGIDVKLRPKAITKYYYRMHRKAYNIGYHNWISPRGKHISAKNLYKIYSMGDKTQTFINYVMRANSILKLNDLEANAIRKKYKHKIALAIKKGQIARTHN